LKDNVYKNNLHTHTHTKNDLEKVIRQAELAIYRNKLLFLIIRSLSVKHIWEL